MANDNGIRVRIQRGSVHIGGVCTEVFTDQTRSFFDFGSPLEGEGNQDKLNIEGLTSGVTNTDAVFLTHYHVDHVGEVPLIIAGIPVYMHKTARRILQAQQEHKVSVGEVVWAKDVKELEVGEPVIIKDLKITPLASDHSASDSLMYLVEGQGKRILITGDYRLHGFYSDRLRETLSSLGPIDLMITEGTNIDRGSPYYHDEEWVTEQFKRIIDTYKYVFLLVSSSNIDRIAAFSRCVPKGRYVLADKFQKELQEIADESREDKFKSNKVLYYSEYLDKKMDDLGFGMVVRANDHFLDLVKEYFRKYQDDTCMIYSMWSGYEERYPAIREMLDASKTVERIHVSGHITKEDLKDVIGMVAPEKLIIYHTSWKNKDGNELDIPKGTELLSPEDGEVVTI